MTPELHISGSQRAGKLRSGPAWCDRTEYQVPKEDSTVRKTDIEVGADYAVVEQEGGIARRVRVDGFGGKRTVYEEGRWGRSHTVADGVKVTYLKDDGTPFTRTMTETVELDQPIYQIGQLPVTVETIDREVEATGVVQSRHIKRTWSEQAMFNQRDAERQQAKQDAQAAAERRIAEVRSLIVEHGLTTDQWAVGFHTNSDRRSYRTDYRNVVIPLAVVEQLISIAGLEHK